MRGVEFGSEDRAGDVEILAGEAGGDVFYGELELFDGEVGCAVQEHKRAARFDEFPQVLDALLADAARVFIRHRAFRVAVEDLVGRLVGEDDRLRCRNEFARASAFVRLRMH